MVFALLFSISLLSLLGMSIQPAAAKAQKVYFTGTSFLSAQPDPGDMWLSDGVVHARGVVNVWTNTGSDPRVVDEDATVVANFNVDAMTFAGPMWGTFISEPDSIDGYWEGTWTGKLYADGTSMTRLIAHGKGALEGQMYFCVLYCEGFVGEFYGYILETKV